MSTQACRIRGIGFSFPYDERLFSFLNSCDEDRDYVDLLGLGRGYYEFARLEEDKTTVPAIIFDGMGGDFINALFVQEVNHIEDTWGTTYWHHSYYCPDNKKHIKEYFETLFQRKIEKEPEELCFEWWL